MLNSFFGTLAATKPVPRGAGINRTVIEPHLPVTCSRDEGERERGWISDVDQMKLKAKKRIRVKKGL
jgi:hypothetical protein